MADERRLQLVDVDEDEETVRVLGLYSRFESLLILSYLFLFFPFVIGVCKFQIV